MIVPENRTIIVQYILEHLMFTSKSKGMKAFQKGLKHTKMFELMEVKTVCIY